MSTLPAAKAAGGKRIALLHLDVPAVAFFVNLVKKQADHLGMTIAADIPIPVTATDMSTYVAQALNAKPTSAFCVVAPATNAAIFKQIVAQGKNPKTFSLISSQNGMTPAVLASMPKNVTNGMTIVGWNLNPKSPSDSGKPVVKQYLRELKAAKQSLGTRIVTANGFGAWAEMHVIADALKAKGLAPTTANVQRAMLTSKMPALMQKYGHLPRDFSKPAFPNDPVLKNLRIFSSTSYYYRLNAKQQPIALVSKPVSINKTPKFAK